MLKFCWPSRQAEQTSRSSQRPVQVSSCDGVSSEAPLRRGRGLEHALSEDPRPGGKRKLSTTEEAMLVALAGRNGHHQAHGGRAHWTLDLLAGEMVGLTPHDHLSTRHGAPTSRRERAQALAPEMWCIPKVDAEYVARMEDVLDLYAETPDSKRPVVSFDESPTQLIGEVRQPIPAAPGRLERFDSEYRRSGTANIFMFLDVHRPWRKAKVTDRRTSQDFAECMRDLVDLHYSEADIIRVVMDNLSTHSPAALYESFPPEEADAFYVDWNSTTRRSTQVGLTWWRSRSGCSAASASTVELESDTCSRRRSLLGTSSGMRAAGRIQWMFTVEKARAKLGRAYPTPINES